MIDDGRFGAVWDDYDWGDSGLACIQALIVVIIIKVSVSCALLPTFSCYWCKNLICARIPEIASLLCDLHIDRSLLIERREKGDR